MQENRSPYPPYQKCPCGAGGKYKFCCYVKGFHYYLDSDGSVYKSTPIPKELHAKLMSHRADLEKRLGRPLKPDDKLFPDLDEDTLKQDMIDRARESGAPPAVLYAIKKTGRIVTDANRHLISDVEIEKWDAFVKEHLDLHPDEDPSVT